MRCDVVILGSSFAGSLLGWILASRGVRVTVVDPARHPRFAIGESSTPAADFLLARLAARYGLAALAPLARWGSWQAEYPHVGCGKKRGFSYFVHRAGAPFRDTADHASSLLVAASATDSGSDTHWLRADVDSLLFSLGVRAGMDGREGFSIDTIQRDPDGWRVRGARDGAAEAIHAAILVDSSGTGAALAGALGLERHDDRLGTRTGALFTHVRGLGSFDAIEEAAGNRSTTWPFRSDDAAQHHVFEDGWTWMLRFRDDLASVGFVRPSVAWQPAPQPAAEWSRLVDRYPTVRQLLAKARPTRDVAFVPRMSRLWSRASGPGWAMLPTTAGFVDPLHSSGIAHALSGVERLATLILADAHDTGAWEAYGEQVRDEVRWIDELVGACYAALPDFDRFRLASTLFFLATIRFEEGFARGESVASQGFLAARDGALREALSAARRDILSGEPSRLAGLRERLAPFDPAGLLDPAAGHRFAHTAVDK